ncbi:MAG: hypothetical protein KKE42_08965 [Alphaproteobacteria bacterium]|uniref:hypothetical protein n=1 Tax=Brevundimonas sp. TaxID=1871086 RepID=UPI0017A8190C|nr:hypothetical protein [Brevundimonas sp.]MBA3050043.1 hypothetical protein [Brevundimonas sp.]MBU3971544.1 hypothetical protein [Alphaproteobacteria bacterium]MBU3973913.1 hypothetical protein [Alphaproteobacteria bacterium]MBU4136890.1 hypothetical protein [Alphaproteobacteria bacterium]
MSADANTFPPDILAVVERLTEEMRGLRRDFAMHTATATPGGGILAPIAAEFGSNLFTASEVMRRAEGHVGPLRAALAANLRSLSARGLGRALGRLQGKPCGGLTVSRIGEESAGVIWKICRVDDAA